MLLPATPTRVHGGNAGACNGVAARGGETDVLAGVVEHLGEDGLEPTARAVGAGNDGKATSSVRRGVLRVVTEVACFCCRCCCWKLRAGCIGLWRSDRVL